MELHLRSYRGRSALTGTIIGIDPYSVRVRNPETGEMEKQDHVLRHCGAYRVRIVIPATEMWEQGRERPEFVMQNMVGSSIDFIIIKVDRESGFAIGSRRLALRARRYYFAHRPNLNAIGTRLKCRVMAVGPGAAWWSSMGMTSTSPSGKSGTPPFPTCGTSTTRPGAGVYREGL